jgi:hypothetical protein
MSVLSWMIVLPAFEFAPEGCSAMAALLLDAPPPVETPQSVLAKSCMPELRRVLVTMCDQNVVLSGSVSTYYLKQLAQESIRTTVAGRRIINRLTVHGDLL